MTDIVDRLRRNIPQSIMVWREIGLEAADEIERLRAENETLKKALEGITGTQQIALDNLLAALEQKP